MKTKAIKNLCKLSDIDLFNELSKGFEYIIQNVNKIENDSKYLYDKDRYRGARVLRIMAEEEAAKYLILLDAVRCPRNGKNFSRQLNRIYEHLSKGIYTEYCGMKPMYFHEILKWIEIAREKYYLDGPMDVDWIFHNEIIQKREEAIYVDYVENDNKNIWLTPLRYEKLGKFTVMTPISSSINLVNQLHIIGLTKPESLKIIAEVWRPVEIHDEFSWPSLRELNHHTIKELDNCNQLVEQDKNIYRQIIEEWQYPLHSIDLSMIDTDKDELKNIQKNFNPDI